MKQINKAKMQQIEQFTGKQNKQFKVVPNPIHEKLFNEIVDGVVAEIIKESGADKTYEENIRILAETNKDVTKINVATIFNSVNTAIANPKDTEHKDKYKELYALYQPNVFIDAILRKVFKAVNDNGYTTLLSEDRNSYYLADMKTLRPVALFREQKTYDRPERYKSAHPLAYAIFLTNDKNEWEPIKYDLVDYKFKEGDYDFYPTRKAEDIDLVEFTGMVSLYTDINYAFGIIKYFQKLMEKANASGEMVQPDWAIVPVDIDTLKSNYWYNDEIKIFSVSTDDLVYPDGDNCITEGMENLEGTNVEDISATAGKVTAKATKKLSLKSTTKHYTHTDYDVVVVEVIDTDGNDIIKMNPNDFTDVFGEITTRVYETLPKEKGLVNAEILNPVGGGNVFYIIQPYVKEIVPHIGMTHDIVSGILEPLHHSCLIENLVEQNSDKIIDLIRMLPLLKPGTKLTDIKENLLYRFHDSLHEEYVGFGGSILTDLYLESVPAAELHSTESSDIQVDTSLYCVYTINPVTAVKYGIDNSNVIRATKDIPSFDSLYVIAFKTREEAQAYVDSIKNPLHYCIVEDVISFSNMVEVNSKLYMEYNHNFLDYAFNENGEKAFIRHVF
mgnify:FL=1|jgi:hypothetical protein